jgi:hypothetical protein
MKDINAYGTLVHFLTNHWIDIGGSMDKVWFEFDDNEQNVILHDDTRSFQLYMPIDAAPTKYHTNVTNGYYDETAIAIPIKWMTIENMEEWITDINNNKTSKWDTIE